MVNLMMDNIESKFFYNLAVISGSFKWWSPRFFMLFLYKFLDKFTKPVLHQIWKQRKNLIHVPKFAAQNDHNCMLLLKPTSSMHSNTTTLLSQSYQSTFGSQLKHHHQGQIKLYWSLTCTMIDVTKELGQIERLIPWMINSHLVHQRTFPTRIASF